MAKDMDATLKKVAEAGYTDVEFAGFFGHDAETVKGWLKIFIRRFFSQQFKRSCLPDGPYIGSVTLSPRGGFVMPSDATSALWLAALDNE